MADGGTGRQERARATIGTGVEELWVLHVEQGVTTVYSCESTWNKGLGTRRIFLSQYIAMFVYTSQWLVEKDRWWF